MKEKNIMASKQNLPKKIQKKNKRKRKKNKKKKKKLMA